MISRSRAFDAVSRTVSSASTSGMPARTNAATWREKCMTSERGTLRGVSSISVNLRCLRIFLTSSCCASSSLRRLSTLTASAFARTFLPSGSTATYLNAVTGAGLHHVEGAEHLVDRGDVALDEPQRLGLERHHALRDGEVPELLVGGFGDDELLHLVADHEQLVDTDAALVAGLGAEDAALAPVEGGLRRHPRLVPQRELVRRRLVRHPALG